MDTILRLPRLKTIYRRFRMRPAEVMAPDQVQAVLAEYGLEPLAMPEHPDALGRSGSLVVQTTLGKAILKRYKSSVELPAVIHEHSILTYLAQIDFPAPRLLSAQTGETFVHAHGANYALFEFIQGATRYPHNFLLPAHSRQLVSTAGETLAILHQDLQGFVPRGQNPNGFKSLSAGRWRNRAWFTDKLAHCIAEAPQLSAKDAKARDVHTMLLQRADWITDTLCQLDGSLEAAAPPRLIIHGDYRPSNLLFRRDAPTAVLDFELARLDWRTTDLARAGKAFAYKRTVGLHFDRIKCFLDAYQARYPIATDELQLIPPVWQFLLIRRLIVCWYNYCDAPTKQRESEIRNHLLWLDWLLERQDELLTHLKPLQAPVKFS